MVPPKVSILASSRLQSAFRFFLSLNLKRHMYSFVDANISLDFSSDEDEDDDDEASLKMCVVYAQVCACCILYKTNVKCQLFCAT